MNTFPKSSSNTPLSAIHGNPHIPVQNSLFDRMYCRRWRMLHKHYLMMVS